MYYVLLILAMIVFATQAIRAERLLHSAIWLAGVSALLAIVFYQLGAYQVAVIELSVGAGLVTVLFVFAIGMAGEGRIEVLSPVVLRIQLANGFERGILDPEPVFESLGYDLPGCSILL